LFATTFFGASGVALSFPNGVVWPYFSVATEMGLCGQESTVFGVASEWLNVSLKSYHPCQHDVHSIPPASIRQSAPSSIWFGSPFRSAPLHLGNSFGKTEHRVLARPFGRFADRAQSRGARRLPETASKA
jgi:hypothetical protein